jgi:hypothetical protein
MRKGRPQKPCQECGVAFTRNPKYGRSQWENALYCSQQCMGLAKTKTLAENRPPLEALFHERTHKTDGCWEWKGTIDGYGYGVIDYAGKRYRAHVLSLAYDGRPVGDGQIACHHCDNPRCVRPGHLYPGTPADNSRDASERGRLLRGEKHPQTRLTWREVAEIRSNPIGTKTGIARKYNVSRPTIARILAGKTWRLSP